MSTITKEFTKEQLIERLQHRISVASGFPESEKAQMDLELARIALASLEAEPVAYIIQDAQARGRGRPGFLSFDASISDEDINEYEISVTPLYTAPQLPQPAVPDEDLLHMAASAIDDLLSNKDRSGAGVWADIPAKLRRAAMLQGAEPVTKAYKLPANTPCNDAPEHIWLQTAGVWPENGEFSELTWCSDNQHPDDTLYVRSDVVAGNSPVIPEGWVSCSERMPKKGQKVFYYFDIVGVNAGYYDGDNTFVKENGGGWLTGYVTHWMEWILPAAPKREA
ncbi:DUF551 domain-containing protein [Enterobacter roggenkampii]